MNKKKTDEQVVISVSFATGCYRHIAVPLDYTLEELADVILWAFDFVNDHAHAFFMNCVAWDYSEEYLMAGIDEEFDRPTTDQVTIAQLNLQKGKKFLNVFDFGEEHHFNCRVLRIEKQKEDCAYIVKSVGDSPEQYPSWEA